mgnify:CR=1 FL=1
MGRSRWKKKEVWSKPAAMPPKPKPAAARPPAAKDKPLPRAVLEELLDSLFLIAEADDHLHPQEIAFLREVAAIFGFGGDEFERILASRPGHAGDPEINPWSVLGVAPDADDAAVKAAYRKLLQEHHPDRLIAQGLPAEFIDVATEMTAAINAAYARIKALRRGAAAV